MYMNFSLKSGTYFEKYDYFTSDREDKKKQFSHRNENSDHTLYINLFEKDI